MAGGSKSKHHHFLFQSVNALANEMWYLSNFSGFDIAASGSEFCPPDCRDVSQTQTNPWQVFFFVFAWEIQNSKAEVMTENQHPSCWEVGFVGNPLLNTWRAIPANKYNSYPPFIQPDR